MFFWQVLVQLWSRQGPWTRRSLWAPWNWAYSVILLFHEFRILCDSIISNFFQDTYSLYVSHFIPCVFFILWVLNSELWMKPMAGWPQKLRVPLSCTLTLIHSSLLKADGQVSLKLTNYLTGVKLEISLIQNSLAKYLLGGYWWIKTMMMEFFFLCSRLQFSPSTFPSAIGINTYFSHSF